jgi:1-phosphofructokinase family hexose kinase
MFLCVSLNPAIDKRLRLDRLQPGRVNRVSGVTQAAGGKAIHVAMVLQTLGGDPLWLGFAGGAAGEALAAGVRELSIPAEVVPTAGCTRTNLEIVENGGGVTEILEPGESVGSAELERMSAAFQRIVTEHGRAATAIISGSLPPGVPRDYCLTLIGMAHRHGSKVFLDTSGEPFRAALAGQPDFVKPNREEAESWRGKEIEGWESAEKVLSAMLDAGAIAGAISLGADGLIWRSTSEKGFLARGPKVITRSCVGSGDATLAGFAYAAHKGFGPAESVRLAAACGAANCLADGPGRAHAEDIARLKVEIEVRALG